MKNKKFDKSTLEICEIWANRYKPHDYFPSKYPDPELILDYLVSTDTLTLKKEIGNE